LQSSAVPPLFPPKAPGLKVIPHANEKL